MFFSPKAHFRKSSSPWVCQIYGSVPSSPTRPSRPSRPDKSRCGEPNLRYVPAYDCFLDLGAFSPWRELLRRLFRRTVPRRFQGDRGVQSSGHTANFDVWNKHWAKPNASLSCELCAKVMPSAPSAVPPLVPSTVYGVHGRRIESQMADLFFCRFVHRFRKSRW